MYNLLGVAFDKGSLFIFDMIKSVFSHLDELNHEVLTTLVLSL